MVGPSQKLHVISVESVFKLSRNVEIPTVRFQSLKEWEGNYVRHFWVTGCEVGCGVGFQGGVGGGQRRERRIEASSRS